LKRPHCGRFKKYRVLVFEELTWRVTLCVNFLAANRCEAAFAYHAKHLRRGGLGGGRAPPSQGVWGAARPQAGF